MAASLLLHWLYDFYITITFCDKSTTYSTYNITKYGSSWFDGSSFYNQSMSDFLHTESNLPITSAAHLGLVTGLILAVLLNSQLSTNKGIEWQYWLEHMGMNMMFSILCLMFTLAILPFVGVFLALLALYRKAVEVYLKNTRPQFISLLEGLDAIWAVEDDKSLSIINVLAVVEVEDILCGNELLESFRRAVVSNFATQPFPCPKLFYFRQKCLGYFYWEQQHQLKITDHVRWMKEVEGDNTNGITEDALKGMISELSNSKLPEDHAACWEILISRQHLVKQKSFQTSDVFQAMEEGFPDVLSSSILRYPVLFRIHHSLGDGIALMKLLLSGLADKFQVTEDLRSRTPSPIPTLLTRSDYASPSTNSNSNSRRSSLTFTKANSSSDTGELYVKPKDLNLSEKVIQSYRLPKSEIVIELENLSDEQDKAARNSSPLLISPTISESSSSLINKEQVPLQSTSSARPSSPFLTPCQSPLPMEQYSCTNSPLFLNSRCFSPEAGNYNGCVKETKRCNSPLLLTTRCHSPIIGKAVLKSPSQKYSINTPHSSIANNGVIARKKSVEEFHSASRSTTPFLSSRPTSPQTVSTNTPFHSHSMSIPCSAVHREDSPHMRNATNVQCYQQNAWHCFTSFPQSKEHIPSQGRNFTTIYYYNTSGPNDNINSIKRREIFFETDNKVIDTNLKNFNAAQENNSCNTTPLTSCSNESRNTNAAFLNTINSIKINENLHKEVASNNTMSINNAPNEASHGEHSIHLVQKAMTKTSNVGSNTDAVKCVSTSTQTSPLKSLPNIANSAKHLTYSSAEQKLIRNLRSKEMINRNLLKHSLSKAIVSSATIVADHSNFYVKKAPTLGSCSSRTHSKSNDKNSATTEITMESTEDNANTFSLIKLLVEIWNHFTNHKDEQESTGPSAYVPPSSSNPYIQLLNAINATTDKPKRAIDFAQAACAIVFAPAALINQTLMRAVDSNALHGPSLSGYKVVAWYVDYSGELMECIKRVKNRCGTHFTDVILTGLSASLNSYFSIHPDSCGTIPQSVTVVIPARMEAPEPVQLPQKYSTDSFSEFSESSWDTIQLSTENESNSITLNNRFSVALLTLPISGQQDKILKPRERLYEVHYHSNQLRNSPDYLVNYWLLRVVATLLPTPLLDAVVRSSQSTLVVSNMVGPAKRLSIAGSQLRDIFFWVPHRGATGIGVTVLSYMDRLQLAIMADRALVTCQQDAQQILNKVVSEIKNLEHLTTK